MSQLFKEFYNSFGQAIHPLCKRYAVISRYILKKFRLLIELLIQVYFTALFTFNGYNFQHIISRIYLLIIDPHTFQLFPHGTFSLSLNL
jgi:hypothetical protein